MTTMGVAEEELPRQEVALNALKDIRGVLDERRDHDWSQAEPTKTIDHILHMTYARLRMAGMRRSVRAARWLAKLPGSCFPCWIAKTPGGDMEPYVCFVVEITDGAKTAVGRTVEVRIPAGDAPRIGEALLRTAIPMNVTHAPARGSRHMDPLAGLLPERDC